MQTSESLTDLAKSLSKAQGLMKTAIKDSTNPHFKSRYADLASIWDAIREPLSSNGLSIVQTLSSQDTKTSCTTMLLHESGQWIRDTMTMTPQQNTPQGQGSCATYLRRYMLQSIAGVAPDDDDGNAASYGVSNASKSYSSSPQTTTTTPPKHAVVPPAPTSTAAAPAPSKALHFDKTNVVHVKYVSQFLTARNQLGLFEALAKRLEGKVFTQTAVAEEFKVIDPEAFSEPKEGV
jgi:hypothetical protein